MQHFMDPKSVALIGISRKSGPGSFNLMEIMSDFGYSGKIYPVNPNAGEILGKKAYPSVTAVKKKLDLAGSYDAWRTQSLFGGLEGGFERDRSRRGRGYSFHRRAAHPGGGRRRRGGHGRLQYAQTGPGPW